MATKKYLDLDGLTRYKQKADAKYISQETDPTVPSWAKQSTKPSYEASEIDYSTSVTPVVIENDFSNVQEALDGLTGQLDENVIDLNNQIVLKQDSLVSGTNIKTINNKSILGSGNISTIKGIISVSKTSATTNYPTNKQGFLPFISTGDYSIDARIGTDLTWTTKSVSFEDITGTTYGISIPSGVSLVKVETNVRYQNPASSQININTMIFRDRNGTSTSARAMSQSVPGSSRYTCNFATYISVQEGDFIYIGSWKSTASANVSVSNVDNATGVMLEVIQ